MPDKELSRPAETEELCIVRSQYDSGNLTFTKVVETIRRGYVRGWEGTSTGMGRGTQWAASGEALRWIPVEEKLPEDGSSALIFVPEWEDLYLRYRVAWIDYDEAPPQWVYDGNRVENVTHWMPLPASPPAAPDSRPSTRISPRMEKFLDKVIEEVEEAGVDDDHAEN